MGKPNDKELMSYAEMIDKKHELTVVWLKAPIESEEFKNASLEIHLLDIEIKKIENELIQA